MSDSEFSDSQYANPPTPPHLQKTYDKTKRNLLPEKSGDLYTKSYNNFVKWQEAQGSTSTSARVLVSYFTELSEIRAPSTLWSEYSKLKSTIQIHHGVNIATYKELTAFLKKKSKGYEPKAAPAFTGLQVEDFLVNASDSQYLFEKVALTIGILGACRREELTHLKKSNIELSYSDLDRFRVNPMMHINIATSKNGEARSFLVKGGFYQIVRRYANLRPRDVPHDRFFINYQQGKCTKQAIGINKMGGVPKTIAKFLGLPNPDRYTSHSIRHTGASLFVEGGGHMEDLKRLGGWRSERAANGYVTHSKSSKEKICDKITSAIILPGPSSASSSSASQPGVSSMEAVAGPSSASSSSALRPKTSFTKTNASSSLGSSSATSEPETSSTKAIAGSSVGSSSSGINSENRSLMDSAVSASNKENVADMENQTHGQEFQVHLTNCTNITLHIAKKEDS